VLVGVVHKKTIAIEEEKEESVIMNLGQNLPTFDDQQS
jgi:hypothetical protein